MKKINKYLWALKRRGVLVSAHKELEQDVHPAGKLFGTRKMAEAYLRHHEWRWHPDSAPQIIKVKVSIEEVV